MYLPRLQRNDRPMLRWICGVKDMDGILSEDLLAKLHMFDTTVERAHTLSLMVWACEATTYPLSWT